MIYLQTFHCERKNFKTIQKQFIIQMEGGPFIMIFSLYQNNTEFTDIQRPKYKFAKYTHLPAPMRRDFIVRFHQDYPEYLELVQSHYKRRYKALSEEFQ
ncbi:hypothetical protein M0813_29801 [Anaeramoeba flamelloides]|uniref:Uncharacterized protein n=1 Tax=Anaeramoeba flamelloides TaxID=1746091 RepID=A0ABQ8XN40_9EUKA|nr:hypothetical protein M0813_29801 [Anaeramoeba flamelloides]